MRIALYARILAGPNEGTTGDALAALAAYAARRSWDVALECADLVPGPEDSREGLRSLLEAVRAKAVQGVLVHALSHLAGSLRQLANLGQLLAAQNVALIALEDRLDTTDLGGAIRWRDWLETSARFDRQLRAEATRLARLRGKPWGRPRLSVNPTELLIHWEGRRGRRPLSLREIARKLGISAATVRQRLHELRAAGEVDDEARAQALAAQGGHHRGGRPSNPLDDHLLVAEWAVPQQIARRRGTPPSLSAVAHTLHVSRSRVLSRLRDLERIEEERSPRCITPPAASSQEKPR